MPFFNLKFKISNLKLSKGFTLIELLVVLAVIATLAGAILYSTNNTREKGRDAKRKEELKSLASALTLYYADNNRYPITTDGELKILDYSSDKDDWLPQLDNYLQKQPKDPLQAGLLNSIAGIFKKYTNQIVGSYNATGQVAGATTDSWTIAYDTTETGIIALTFDSVHKVLYAGGSLEGKIYRCDTTTNCDTASDWTLSFDAPPISTQIRSLAFDSASGFIYAGLGDIGDIFRCDTATNCDTASKWSLSLDTTQRSFHSLAIDSVNNVIYAGSSEDGLIYRCDISAKGCNESTDWGVTYSANQTTINSIAYDTANKVLYAGSNDYIYRCDISAKNCDEQSDWNVSYFNNDAGGIYALTFDTVNKVIYAGASSSNIYKCPTSTGCDDSAEWSASYPSTAGPILSLTFDSINGDLYAGTYGGGGLIYRCPISYGCNSSSDWLISYDLPEPYHGSIYSLGFDPANGVVYAGQSSQGYILRSGPITTPPPPPNDPDNPGGDPGSTGGACDGKSAIYCYRVSWNQKHFILWAQLENINDPQALADPGNINTWGASATCKETPPVGSLLNYCLKSAE